MDNEQRKGDAIMEKEKVPRRRRRIILAVSIILVMAIAVGLTYAWFTATGSSGNFSVTMGNMAVGSSFELAVGAGEPGITTDLEGVISNEGTVGMLIKMEMNPKTLIKWETEVDANGRDVLIAPLAVPLEIPNDPNVELSAPMFNDDVLPYGTDDVTGGLYMWLQEEGTDNYYLLIDGDIDVDVLFEISMSGSGMGNKYQDSEIVLTGDLQSTQWWSDEALDDLFGITWDDLVNYPDDSGRRMAVDPVKAQILERIETIRAERS